MFLKFLYFNKNFCQFKKHAKIQFSVPKIISRKAFSNNKNENFARDDPFPKYDKKDFYDENDLIINIGEKETFKGMLVICPTPIGNINDISIRQYEALRNGDILACEDTRKTGKLLELVQLKKMKERFFSEFGISFEEFVNRGGLDMNDEQIKNEFFDKKADEKKEEKVNTEAENNNETQTNSSNSDQKSSNFKQNYHHFYETENDVKNLKKFEDRLEKYENERNFKDEAQKTNINSSTTQQNPNKKSIYASLKSNAIDPNEMMKDENFFDKLKKRVDNKLKTQNKGYLEDLENVVQEVNLNFSEEDPKNFINELKKNLDEPITQEYYKSVKDPEDFIIRKTVIDNSEEDLKEFIEPLAEAYDEKRNLSYKLRTKAKFLMGMMKKYDKKKSKENEEEEQPKSKEEVLEEEMSLHSGLEDHMFSSFKKKIKEEKEKKGRGLLIPFNGENEEAKIPKLIRAMKMGLRIILVSDAGTPGISDPGYRLVKEASKNGIIVEPLPGPSAVITALSACALPTDKFVFIGYLPKNPSDKIAKIEEIKRISYTTVLFESPHRIKRSIETLIEILGPQQEVYVGLELTKKFETHMHGSLESVLSELNLKEEVKGEITIIIAPYKDPLNSAKETNEGVNIDPLEFARKVEKTIKLPEKDLRNLLIEVCDVSTHKANKIIQTVKQRESSIKQFIKRTGVKPDKVNIKPIEESLREDNEGEGKLKTYATKIIKRNRDKSENNN